MKNILNLTILYAVFFCFNVFGFDLTKEKLLNAKYIICIDGGGSKTSMKVINNKGQLIDLYRNQQKSDTIVSTCSNINFVGIAGFEKVLNDLFDNLYVEESKLSFNDILLSSIVIAGFSGGSLVNLKKAAEQFKLKGFKTEQLNLTSDPELCLELIKPKGIVIISGTGSIAFGIEDNNKFRTGGFGKLLNDGGNGYSMGVAAIRAALEDDHGYGINTILTQKIKEFFKIEKIYDLVVPIHSGEIIQDKIASLTEEIFKYASSDKKCSEIINQSIDSIALLIVDTFKRMQSQHADVILVGGLFNQGSSLINQIYSNNLLCDFLIQNNKTINLIDMSKNNIAFEVALLYLNK